MQEHYISFGAVPVIILIVAVAYECLRWVRRDDRLKPCMRLSGWFIRPWGAWALFNLVFRFFWDLGHNNRRTFPFFANLWNNEETLGQGLLRLASWPAVWIWGSVSIVLLAVLLCVLTYAFKRNAMPTRRLARVLIACYVVAIALQLSIACMPKGAGLGGEGDGSLLSCWKVNATMLYAVPVVKSSKHFMRNFVALQPRLRHTIHGLSHPPGAALSMYWLGKAVGAKRMNIRLWSTRIRYALALPLFSGLSFFLVYALGRQVFDSHRIGMGASALWLCAPSVLSYNTFAQEGVYAVFFIASLLLTWIVVTRERVPWWALVLLGLDFFCLTMLNYSWCVATTIFATFLLIIGRIRKWKLKEYFRRGVIPLGIMTVLAGAVIVVYRLNYWVMYCNAREYVDQWYRYSNNFQKITFYIGGQIDILLMLGAMTASAFLVALINLRKDGIRKPRNIFLLTILIVYALPLIFGPNCLRIETARCFSWVIVVPIAFAAHRLMMSGRPTLYLLTAAATSGLSYVGMRLFMDFAP